ncbi:hypothetical protein [Pseudoalteromonas umbrosa]|uniref:hypothetical protein n=1 Tax=Pseudoalteromonas umbrosa TaxID=3048489 RepID=UPI0024C33447|nr:hypothetical protein [Pseudoalteromonas sp. B95]MDK1285942.1 hypothetical protein [Pseudoalteromonas sp. B95]
MRFIINLLCFLLNHSPILNVADDGNFGTIELSKLRKEGNRFRFSLFCFVCGSRILYFATYCSRSRKLRWFYNDQFVEVGDDEIKKLRDSTIAGLGIKDGNDTGYKYLSDFYKEKLSQENARISISMQKLTSYRSFLLFLAAIPAPLFNIIISGFGVLFSILLYAFYYLNCFYLYKTISSAISIRQRYLSSANDQPFEKLPEKSLAQLYLYDLVSYRKTSEFKVAMIRNAEKYLRILSISLLVIFFSYVLVVLKTYSGGKEKVSSSEIAFVVYNDLGQLDIKEYTKMISKVSEHKGEIKVILCSKANKKSSIEKMYSIIDSNEISLVYIESENKSHCTGEVLIVL